MANPATRFNFLLAAANRAIDATLSSTGEDGGTPAQNLVAYPTENLTFVTGNAGAVATEIFVVYTAPIATRAINLAGGLTPVTGSRFRVARGYHLTPTVVEWNAELANTNATGALLRGIDPRTAPLPGSFIGPSTPGSDWSVTLDFAESEFGWSVESNQKIVIAPRSSVGSGDPTLKVEVKDFGGSFVTLGTTTVSTAYGAGETAPLYSFRLPFTGISSPPEVRISATFVTSGDVNLHGLAFVGPVRPDDDALRLTGSFLATTGTIGGTAAATRGNPNDLQLAGVPGAGIDIDAASDVRVAVDPDPRELVSATLELTWLAAGAGPDDLSADLFHDGVFIAAIASYANPTPGTIQRESTVIPLGGLPDTDGQGLEIKFSRVGGGGGTARFTGVAVHGTFTSSTNPTYDSGFGPVQEEDTNDLTGGGAIDGIGRSPEVSISRAFVDPVSLLSSEVLAPDTYVDLDVPNDPNFPTVPLTMASQPDRAISFRTLFEGPGLPGIELEKGISVAFEDTSVVDRTLGGSTVSVDRRIFRGVTFKISHVPPEIGAGQLGALFNRVGTTVPVLFIVTPSEPGLSHLFSVFALVNRDPSLTHAFGTIIDAKIELREY